MKVLIYTLFIVLYGLVTMFGLGPVLLADGTIQERMLTLAVVIFIYVLLTVMLVQWRKKRKQKKRD